MAPLSRPLSGCTLEQDHYCNALARDVSTIDLEKEKLNLKQPGEVLRKMQNDMNINGFGVYGKYVSGEGEQYNLFGVR